MSSKKTVRVVLQQPALPRYRYPVFRALSKRDLHLVVIYENVPDIQNVVARDLDVRYVPARTWQTPVGPLFWARSQWRCADRKTCDVLILTWNTRYLSLVPALLRARRNGVATILWGHGYSKHDSRTRLWLRRAVTRLATAVLFYDARSASLYIEHGGKPDSTFVAPNAIDQGPIKKARTAWMNSPDRLADFKRVHGLNSGPVLLFVSRLNANRRLDLLLESIAMLAVEHPTLQLVIVGDGASEKLRLERRAAELGIADRIRFVGAEYDEDELAPWFLSADVMAFPSSMGLGVLTAFGFGLPVIANDAPSSNGPEWTAIRNGKNGLLFAAGDAESLSDSLIEFFTDNAKRQKMSDEALRTVHTVFSLDSVVDGIDKAIRYSADRLEGPELRHEPHGP